MSLRDLLVRLGQRLPPWLRWKVAASPLSIVIRRALNLLSREDLVIVPLGGPLRGHKMRLNWRHHKEYVFGVYEPTVVEVIQRVVQSGWVCVDVGAHIGYFTLLLAKQVGAKGKVIAFEPFPSNFQTLCENITLNGYRNVVLENKAVMEHSGLVSLEPYGDALLPFSTFAHFGSGGIPAVSLDDYFAACEDKPNFVKIDVEGTEAAVLRGMKRVLCEDRPIIVVELHAFDQYGENHPAFEPLKEAGYTRISALGKRRREMHILAQPA